MTCMKTVSLKSEETVSGLKGYIAAGTCLMQGEEVTCRGRVSAVLKPRFSCMSFPPKVTALLHDPCYRVLGSAKPLTVQGSVSSKGRGIPPTGEREAGLVRSFSEEGKGILPISCFCMEKVHSPVVGFRLQMIKVFISK